MLALLAGCSTPTPAPLPPTPAATATPVLAPTATPVGVATATAVPAAPTPTTAPASASGSGSAATVMLSGYLDDRSTPSGLVLSLYNAINRKEYLRAYSYWETPASDPNVGSFEHYSAGFQSTVSVQVTLGSINSGVGAGQIYYVVPVALKAQTAGGQTQAYSGCYTLHLGNPASQTAPPFHSLGIQSAELKPAGADANLNALLASACAPASGTLNPVPTTDPNTIAASNYLDDRSDAVTVLSSLFNAVNRHEYARAYSYWQSPTQTFEQFQQGYQNTAAVEATFGTPTGDAGAGQMRFRVPVALKASAADGKIQYFAGCYQLHLAQPAIQGVPPFQPLGIERAVVKAVAGQADASGQMAGVCANMQ